MAVSSDSYGTAAGVGKLTPRWSGAANDFAATTRPTQASVETWIDQVSSALNAQLAQAGFDTPITVAKASRMLVMFVESEVAEIVEGVNGSGRFGPTNGERSSAGSRFRIIFDDVQAFVQTNAAGIARLGAGRSEDPLSNVLYRDTDNSGAETFPLFQRKSFGETFTDADPW